MEAEDVHDQASLDQYWRENGGRPYTVAEEKAIEDAERAVITLVEKWHKATPVGLPVELREAIDELLRLRAARKETR